MVFDLFLGTTQGISVIENIMEHIADVLKKDPLKVREANYLKPGDDLIPAHGIQEAGAKFEGENLVPTMIEEMKKNAKYEERKAEADEFNRVRISHYLWAAHMRHYSKLNDFSAYRITVGGSVV